MSFNENEYEPLNEKEEESRLTGPFEDEAEKDYENIASFSAEFDAVKGDPAEDFAQQRTSEFQKAPFNPQEFRWDDVEPPRSSKGKREKAPKEPGSGKGLKVFAVVVSCVLVVALAALAFVLVGQLNGGIVIAPGSSDSQSADDSSRNDGPSLVINETPENNVSGTADGPLTIPQIAAKVKPSVVGVVTYTKDNSLTAASEGSGIIMTSDGYIITNEHVINGADAIKVVMENGDEFEAKVVGADNRTDLAVIKIEKENLTAAQFGDSSKLVAGETVVAIGNPGGLKYAGSVTMGIVSATDRISAASVDSGYALSCIQTDAAINPGNSGGALVNTYGQVVGINSSKIVGTGYEGIGFSIAINEAKPIVDDLITYGYVKDRVKIGVTVTAIDEVLANLYGVPQGLRIVALESTSDAAAKGLQVGDIITKVDGEQMKAFSDLSAILKTKKAGDTIALDVYRQTSGTAGRTFSVVLELREDRGIQETASSVTSG